MLKAYCATFCLSIYFILNMILGMIDLTTHDEKTLRVVEGQVLDDSKNTIITKEEDEFVNFISYLTISIHDSVKSIN